MYLALHAQALQLNERAYVEFDELCYSVPDPASKCLLVLRFDSIVTALLLLEAFRVT